MRRHAVTAEPWTRPAAVIPKQQRGPSAKIGDRQFVDAVLFRAKTGQPWRDVPERFGPWESVYNRFNNWAQRGYWTRIFIALQIRVDKSGSMIDGSNVRAHLPLTINTAP